MRVGGQRHAPATLSPGMTEYSLHCIVFVGSRASLENLAPIGISPWIAQLIASHYTDWAVPAHTNITYITFMDSSEEA